ncbi:MAG: hypothetical protein F4206_03385 [Gammaproteobacteria bacterium]|nr:hypothetical protein [Gammaproteobacteria bacterium]MYG65759.1 hypothetical protein [Gammaproteobacteria bacterium]
MIAKYPPPIKFPHKTIIQRSILKVLDDRELHYIRDIRDRVADDLKITAAALSRQYGEVNAFEKRMNNILTETKDQGLIESPKRGYYQLVAEYVQPPKTEPGLGICIPDQPLTREAYRKWLISELARIEGLTE